MRSEKPSVATHYLAGAVIAALMGLGAASVHAQADNVRTPSPRAPSAGDAAKSGAGVMEPGYVNLSDGVNVRTAYGECWRSRYWSPAMAAEPCDAVAQASAPARVVAAAPKPEPAPAATPTQPQTIVAAKPLLQKITLQTDVLFEFDKAELRESGKARLDQVAQQLKDASVEEIVAIGHTDPIGSEEYNEKLSLERAEAVKQYLVQQGIEDAKVVAEGRGESERVTDGQCKGLQGTKLIACLQPDRRVEIEVFGTREVAAGEAQPSTGATSAGSGASAPGSGAGSSPSK